VISRPYFSKHKLKKIEEEIGEDEHTGLKITVFFLAEKQSPKVPVFTVYMDLWISFHSLDRCATY